MVAPLGEAKIKGGARGSGGGRGGGAGGTRRVADSFVELVPSSSVLSSSSQRSEKSKALIQRWAAGCRTDPQDLSKSQVMGFSLVWSDCFIGSSDLSVTQELFVNFTMRNHVPMLEKSAVFFESSSQKSKTSKRPCLVYSLCTQQSHTLCISLWMSVDALLHLSTTEVHNSRNQITIFEPPLGVLAVV